MGSLTEHELRRSVVNEMHLRKWPPLNAPCQIFQILRTHDADQETMAQTVIDALPSDAKASHSQPRHVTGSFSGGASFTWEQHSEASTTSLFLADGAAIGSGTVPSEPSEASELAWAKQLPGKVIRATRLIVTKSVEEAEALLPLLGLDRQELVSCYVGATPHHAGARIWSDFRIGPDGFGMAIVAANDLGAADLSRAVQRFQELGNYRNLALLGLPVAQSGWRELDAVEKEINRLTGQIANASVRDDDLLDAITKISIRLISDASAHDFRLDATQAYAQIVEDRLADLNIGPCEGYQSLADFTQRRFLPAVRTCSAHQRRMQQLALRAEQFVALFRTRIETRIENQNAQLLASMERATVRQLRLQQLVEGLSVVALSYYALGLLVHILEGVEVVVPQLHSSVVAAGMTPVLVAVIWWTMRRMKAKHLQD